MNTSNTFLCYFPTYSPKDKIYIPICDLDYSGSPLVEDGDYEGDEMDSDTFLYKFDGTNYIQL